MLDSLPAMLYRVNMQITKKQLSEAMRELGRKGGKARAKALSPKRRSEIARRAAKARWYNAYHSMESI